MIFFPHAKINLGLHILRKRTDGFHAIETLIYPVKIYDTLEVVSSAKTQFQAYGNSIPGNSSDNLCLKALALLAKDFPIPPISIHLLKNIPVGAGLGGGSSDAAFLLRLLNERFHLKLNNDQVRAYAAQLGSDCSFFIDGQPVIASGRGEVFEPFPISLQSYFLLVVKPDVAVSTTNAYAACRPRIPATSLKNSIQQPVETWKSCLVNDFEETVFQDQPEICTIKDELYKAGALYAAMSGSGSSVFGIFREPVELKHLEQKHKIYYNV